MMSKELLKKAGILSVAFGLVASPAAFAQEPADPANNISPDEQPVETQSESTTDSSNYDSQELTHDEGDNASDMEPSSTSQDDSESGYDSTDELPEENSGM
ncbi:MULTISPECIES: hypothetical protein [unclassified Halomonas]|uniref:hypothetical protein n=1 Tax=Halomonas sp. N3-2A TaxID=2014541 RepID=UPI000B5B190A|nr:MULTISPECIES: hypothetical protein [unclassified Halomonas]ASK21125.1 hypothetical protein CEK60_18285 [Halomonas sp. N3-2A]UTD56908.1 hypothetical protein NF683_06690 [Halomonas sp. MS1]